MLCNEYNTELIELQDVRNGKLVDWKEKKIKTQYIADSYFRIAQNLNSKKYDKKALNVLECGSFLEFKRYITDNSLKLNNANFCKDRLCPMCSWRRSLKIFGQVSKVMDYLQDNNNYDYLFLTLTCENVKAEKLQSQIDSLFKSYDRFVKHRQIKRSIKGWYRGLEITYNESTDTYHPHFHIILVVNKSYFKSKDYISQKKYCEYWKESMDVLYDPIVHVTKIASNEKNISKAVAETAKYTVKDSDLIHDDFFIMDNVVYTLDNAMYNRRLCAFGGVMKQAHKLLNLDDSENGDLINNNIDEELRDDVQFVIESYHWHVGFNMYYRK